MVQGLLDAQPPQQQAPGDFPHEGAIGERTPFTFGGGPSPLPSVRRCPFFERQFHAGSEDWPGRLARPDRILTCLDPF